MILQSKTSCSIILYMYNYSYFPRTRPTISVNSERKAVYLVKWRRTHNTRNRLILRNILEPLAPFSVDWSSARLQMSYFEFQLSDD